MTMYYDAFDEVIAGEAVAFPAGGGDTAVSAEENNGEGSMVVAPFPMVPGSPHERISDAGPNQGWSVTNWAVDQDLAVALIEHILSPESQQLLWENTDLPPNRSDLAVESDHPLFDDYLGIIEHPTNRTTFMAFTDAALAIFQREASNLIAGRTSVEAILEEADAAQQRALSELGQ
jgi:ABC-type glycerol-3-phosphate transport system substrate-binding protein